MSDDEETSFRKLQKQSVPLYNFAYERNVAQVVMTVQEYEISGKYIDFIGYEMETKELIHYSCNRWDELDRVAVQCGFVGNSQEEWEENVDNYYWESDKLDPCELFDVRHLLLEWEYDGKYWNLTRLLRHATFWNERKQQKKMLKM